MPGWGRGAYVIVSENLDESSEVDREKKKEINKMAVWLKWGESTWGRQLAEIPLCALGTEDDDGNDPGWGKKGGWGLEIHSWEEK